MVGGLAQESVFFTSDAVSKLGSLSECDPPGWRMRTDGSPAGTLSFVGHIVRLRWTEDGA